MTQFTSYTIETAPEAARPIFEGVKGAFGFVPNLQSFMAESPELLASYTALWDHFSKTTLTAHEQQVVYLTSNFENECCSGLMPRTSLSAKIRATMRCQVKRRRTFRVARP